MGGPWTWSMDPVHILMDLVHGPGPWRGSMDQGSMFSTFPFLNTMILITLEPLRKHLKFYRGSYINLAVHGVLYISWR